MGWTKQPLADCSGHHVSLRSGYRRYDEVPSVASAVQPMLSRRSVHTSPRSAPSYPRRGPPLPLPPPAACPHGKLLVTILGRLAAFERELIRRARTGAVRKRAKDRGVRFGRPRKMSPHQRQEALQRLAAGETYADLARAYNVDATTIGRLAAASPSRQARSAREESE
jgi:helix-turn-helix resolvase-like protein